MSLTLSAISSSPSGSLCNIQRKLAPAAPLTKKFSFMATILEYRGTSATLVPSDSTSSSWASVHSRRFTPSGLS